MRIKYIMHLCSGEREEVKIYFFLTRSVFYICVNIFYTPKVNNYITQLDILKTYLAMIENQKKDTQN